MDILEFLCVMVAIIVTGGIVFAWIKRIDALKLQELAGKQKLSDIRQKSAMERYKAEKEEPEVGPWVSDVIGSLGFDPMVLFEEEMPAQLKAFLPMIKGFVDSGGLKKLLGQAGPAAPGEEERSAI